MSCHASVLADGVFALSPCYAMQYMKTLCMLRSLHIQCIVMQCNEMAQLNTKENAMSFPLAMPTSPIFRERYAGAFKSKKMSFLKIGKKKIIKETIKQNWGSFRLCAY